MCDVQNDVSPLKPYENNNQDEDQSTSQQRATYVKHKPPLSSAIITNINPNIHTCQYVQE